MFVDRFRAQLDRVAKHFHDVHVPGSDFRQRHAQSTPPTPPADALELSQLELDKLLRDLPLINYRRVVAAWTGLRLHDARNLMINSLHCVLFTSSTAPTNGACLSP